MSAFARSYAAFTQAMYRAADGLGQGLNQLRRAVRDFLGVDLSTVDTVCEEYAPHEVVDLDRALSELAEEYRAARHGVRGPGGAHLESLEEFFENHTPFSLGASSCHRTAIGPDESALVVARGLTMASIDPGPTRSSESIDSGELPSCVDRLRWAECSDPRGITKLHRRTESSQPPTGAAQLLLLGSGA